MPLVPRISATIETMRPLFEAEWPTSAAVFLPGGNGRRMSGALFRNEALAATYERICREAAGDHAGRSRIEAAQHGPGIRASSPKRWAGSSRGEPVLDASGRRHRGLLTAQDFARLAATASRTPVAYDYHGYTVLKCGPCESQGPVFLQQLALLLRGFDIGAMDPLGAEFVHTVTECAKLAYRRP